MFGHGFLRRRQRTSVLAAAIAVLLGTGRPSVRAQSFVIQVVDSQSGRGVPLVELAPLGGSTLLTDSRGLLTISDAALLGTSKFWGVRSYGYSEQGRTIALTPGGQLELAVDRRNLAERLYRVTGPLIYGETIEAGLPAPIAAPLHNANVRGQDSVQTAVYHGEIRWFWGDTLYEAGFGNFRTAGAVSELPGSGGLDPAVGVDLAYFVNASGSAREMMPLADPGPVWIDGVFVVRDASRQERMLAHYSRIEPGSATFNVLEHGLAMYNDATNTFQRLQSYSPTAPLTPQGHAFQHSVAGIDYVYFAQDYPSVRVRANWLDATTPTQWEAFTPLVAGARYDAANPALERDAQGRVVFGWKTGADPLTTDMLNDLVARGHLSRDASPFRLEDAATGRDVSLHRASVQWNDFRQAWVMIGVESFGASFLGEVWYAEAPAPEGPWNQAVKVVTHDRGPSGDYTFYNPALHPYFDQQGGRLIYFEGTYANTFSGNPTATPLYDYNQMMYRLDLATVPRLSAWRGDYDLDGDVDGADLMAWQRELGGPPTSGVGADGDRNGVVQSYDLEIWAESFGGDGGLADAAAASNSRSTPTPEPAGGFVAIIVVASTSRALRRSRCGAARRRRRS